MVTNRSRDRKAGGSQPRCTPSQWCLYYVCFLGTYTDAPALPLPDGSAPPPKDPKQEMEDFLDDLLT